MACSHPSGVLRWYEIPALKNKHKDPKRTREYQLNFFGYEVLGRHFDHEIEKIELPRKRAVVKFDFRQPPRSG